MNEDSERSQSASTNGAGQAVALNLTLPREHPWKQPAVYIAILALIISVGGEWRRWVALDDEKHSNAMWMALVYTEYDAAKSKLDAQGIHLKTLPPPPQ
jgi:hypothetical protein